MNAPKLCLHAGGRLATRDELNGLNTPVGTSTHFPIPHRDLIDLTADRLNGLGLRISHEQHGISHEGARYFGLFGLTSKLGIEGSDGASASDGYEMVLGLRNSHDKSFPAGLSLGSHVFVCDNLAFSGEVTIGRRHTRFIMRDLPRLVAVATGKIVEKRASYAKRVEAYKNAEVNDAKAHDLIVRALDHGVIGATKIEKVVREWRKPAHEEFAPRNAWSLFNAFTETMKEYNTEGVYKRTQPLHGMFDAYCGIAGANQLALAV